MTWLRTRVIQVGAAVGLGVLGVGAAVVAADGDPDVRTQTFTHEDVVTYTVPPAGTVTSPPPPAQTVTVTVTNTTTTTPPTTTTTPPTTTTTPPAPASLYLSPTGNDAGACSSAAPCKTFARAYTVAAAGAVVSVRSGVYPAQNFAGGYQASQAKGTKVITFRGETGNLVRQLHSGSPNITYDGIHVDANRTKTSGAAFEMGGGSNVVFKNGSIGNVTDEKGALVEGNMTFDNVVFHDVRLVTDGVHNECVYAVHVPGFTIRNSTFRNCVTMDLFFTSGTWWSPPSPQYGNVTIEDNYFGKSVFPDQTTAHYVGMFIGCINGASCDGTMNNWKIRRNFFENDIEQAPATGTGNVFCGNTGAAPTAWKTAC